MEPQFQQVRSLGMVTTYIRRLPPGVEGGLRVRLARPVHPGGLNEAARSGFLKHGFSAVEVDPTDPALLHFSIDPQRDRQGPIRFIETYFNAFLDVGIRIEPTQVADSKPPVAAEESHRELRVEPNQSAEPKPIVESRERRVAREIELKRTAFVGELLVPERSSVIETLPRGRAESFFRRFAPSLPRSEWPRVVYDHLSPEAKEGLLREMSQISDFVRDRSVPGFQARQSVEIVPKSNFRFRGRSYVRGERAVVPLDGFLHPTVEYASEASSHTAGHLELHFRGADARELERDIKQFFDYVVPSIRGPNPRSRSEEPLADHTHLVADKPTAYIERLRAQGLTDNEAAAGLAAFHSVVELNMIFTNLSTIDDRALTERRLDSSDAPPLVSFLQREKFRELFSFYRALVEGRNLTIDRYGETGTSLKKNNAGARWGSTYSDPNLWGIELRLPGYRFSQSYVEIAEAVRTRLENQDFNISAEEARRYGTILRQSTRPSDVWFSISPTENVESFNDPALRAKAATIVTRFSRDLEAVHEPSTGSTLHSIYNLMLFDWSRHPLLSSDGEATSRIKRAQHAYFDRILRDGIKSVSVKDFLDESGVRQAISRRLQGRVSSPQNTASITSNPAASSVLETSVGSQPLPATPSRSILPPPARVERRPPPKGPYQVQDWTPVGSRTQQWIYARGGQFRSVDPQVVRTTLKEINDDILTNFDIPVSMTFATSQRTAISVKLLGLRKTLRVAGERLKSTSF